jgi:SAM-dependent methyltransferase
MIGGQVAECAICGHLTLWPQPDDKAALEQYTESAYVVTNNVGTAIFDNQAFHSLKSYDRRKNLTVLDVGCGLGAFLKKCVQEKHRAVGIEVTKNIVDQLVREGLDVHHKSLSEFRDTQQRYDWVACIDVIEHMRDPLAAIEALADLVKRQGLLVIETPNGDAIAAYGEKAYGLHVDKEHLNYFRPNQLVRLFEHHGLSLVCKKYCPAGRGLGRVKMFGKNTRNFTLPSQGSEHVYRKKIKPVGIRAVVERLPPGFRGVLRSMAQIGKRICAIDEIVTGKAHVLILVMKRP